MKLLLDTNVIIHVEDHPTHPTSMSKKSASLLRIAQEAQVNCVVSAATRADLLRAPELKRGSRLRQLERYHVLEPVSDVSDLAVELEIVRPLSPQDFCDLEILTLLMRGVADVLVTNDVRLRRRAERVGLKSSVLNIDEAHDMCSGLLEEPVELLSVRMVQPHQVPLNAPIFASLKAAYPPSDPNGGFEYWWRVKVVGGERNVLLIGDSRDPMGLCALKSEESAPHANTGKALKLSPFKVDERFSGARLGELLLRAAIEYARANSCEVVYLEILPDQELLIDWLAQFGFVKQPTGQTAKGELVVAKDLYPVVSCDQSSPLFHHIEHGPGHFCSARNFVVPIQTTFHSRLFPEVMEGMQAALPLYMQEHPCGNAIRKAYISRANTRMLQPGDGLIFLRTGMRSESSVSVIAVVEETLRPTSFEDLVRFVANRSVYTVSELNDWMSNPTGPLGVLFRLDRILPRSLPAHRLIENGVFLKAPQSIQRIPEEANKWLLNEIELQS